MDHEREAGRVGGRFLVITDRRELAAIAPRGAASTTGMLPLGAYNPSVDPPGCSRSVGLDTVQSDLHNSRELTGEEPSFASIKRP